MHRPQLVHFTAIVTKDQLSLRASMAVAQHVFDSPFSALFNPELLSANPLAVIKEDLSSPWDNIGLLKRRKFRMKIVAYTQEKEVLFSRAYDSDSFGTFYIRIALVPDQAPLHTLQVYEVETRPGLELLVGSYIPLQISEPKRIIISDFDKTLVDTRYSTTREVMHSLTRPIDTFPSVGKSIELLQTYIKKKYQPFILTASPHFYEQAIRDWLYKNQIYTAEIFLKDYRRIFSLTDGDLVPKDLKAQGFYKLNHLVNILLMTGIPQELVLMGDGFEADTMIYLTLALILTEGRDPWEVWNAVKWHEAFLLTPKQHAQFLNKMYQLKNLLLRNRFPIMMKIFIRKKNLEDKIHIPIEALKRKEYLVEYYVG